MSGQTYQLENSRIRPKQSANLLQPLLDGLSEPVIITAWDGKVVQVNGAAAGAFGCEQDVLLGSAVQELIGGLNDKVLQEIIKGTRQGERLLLEGAHCSRADHTTFDARVTVCGVIVDVQNRLCFHVHNTATEVGLAGAQAQVAELSARAEALESRLNSVARMIHQLSQPLQILMSMAEEDGNEPYKHQLHRLVQTMQVFRQQANRAEPPAAAAANAAPPAAAVPGLVATEPNRVLIADDEMPLRELFGKIVRDNYPGLEIDLAHDGRSAVEMFERRHHAVIILDVLMPVMNGGEVFTAVGEFCERSKWRMPSVIICTGFALPPALGQRLKEDGIHGIIQKPIRRASLLKSFDRCLSFHLPAEVS